MKVTMKQIVAIVGLALAQSGAFAAMPDTIPKRVAPEATVPDTDVAKRGGSLTDKLNATGGVIHPEGDIDPKMRRLAPATGTIRVIPPLGSPGRQRGVERTACRSLTIWAGRNASYP